LAVKTTLRGDMNESVINGIFISQQDNVAVKKKRMEYDQAIHDVFLFMN
jgi:hypothetical protein